MIGVGAGQCATVTGSHNNFLGTYAGKCASGSGVIITSLVVVQDTVTPLEMIITSLVYCRILNTTGSYNNFFGSYAGYYQHHWMFNNFIGNAAGFYNTTGSCNNFIGHGAG